MIWRHQSIPTLVESLNDKDYRSKSLGFSHLDDIWLYAETAEKLLLFIKAKGNFLKSPNKPFCFHAATFYISAKVFLRALRAVFFVHQTDSVLELVEFLNTFTSYTLMTSVPSCRYLLAV